MGEHESVFYHWKKEFLLRRKWPTYLILGDGRRENRLIRPIGDLVGTYLVRREMLRGPEIARVDLKQREGVSGSRPRSICPKLGVQHRVTSWLCTRWLTYFGF